MDCDTATTIITCPLPSDTTSVDVAAVVSSLAGQGVTSETPIWAQAWGGNGGEGAGYNVRAAGGVGGYAQTVFSLDDLQSDYGTSTLYYYLGEEGANHGSSTSDTPGGDGGASTVLAAEDLSSQTPTVNEDQPTQGNVLVIAAGAGGGGGENANKNDVGDTGGVGGVAVATNSASATGDGGPGITKQGQPSDHSGTGGTCSGGGEKGKANGGAGDDGASGVGGAGGGGGQLDSGHYGPTGWQNGSSLLSEAGGGGHGAPGIYEFPDGYAGAGGGGGGGYGGGGGGGAAYSDSDPGAGGGGCSFAAEYLDSDLLAPSGAQGNPSGKAGFAQLVFDLATDTVNFETPAPTTAPGNTGTFTAKYSVATKTSTITFYAASGTYVGAWDPSKQTVSEASGKIDLENAGGHAIDQVLSLNQGASITPVSDGNACGSEQQWLLSGSVQIKGVQVFGYVEGDVALTGCGSITDQVTYSGSLSNITTGSTSGKIDSASVSGLIVDMTPSMVAKAAPKQRLHNPLRARVGCQDQACQLKVAGLAELGRKGTLKRSKARQVKIRRLKTKKLQVSKGQVKRLRLRFRQHHRRTARRLANQLDGDKRAELHIKVKAHGERGTRGQSDLKVRLRP